jgi:hypothetical protein
VHCIYRSYDTGDKVFLWVKPHKSLIKFAKGTKLSPRFGGNFKVVEKKGPVAYRLSLPDSLRRIHDVFHVLVLRHYISDPSHVINMSLLQVLDEGSLIVDPICILDHHTQKIGRQIVD